MITRLAHVCLNVSNLQNTIHFYSDILKIPVKFKFQKGDKFIGAYFKLGEMNFIEVFEKPNLQIQNTGIVHFCLETDNIDSTISEINSQGVECSKKLLGSDQSWQTWIQDPDGNRIEIHEYTSTSAQLVGENVEVDW